MSVRSGKQKAFLSLKQILNEGPLPNKITLFYGEEGTGKTSVAVHSAVEYAEKGLKTMFIDSDFKLFPERLTHLSDKDPTEISKLVFIAKPTTFMEQSRLIDSLESLKRTDSRLIIVDSITSLYLLEYGDSERRIKLNKELNRQVAVLKRIAKLNNYPVLITSHIKSSIQNTIQTSELVASRVFHYWSDFIIRLDHTGQKGIIKATLEKPIIENQKSSLNLKITMNSIFNLE